MNNSVEHKLLEASKFLERRDDSPISENGALVGTWKEFDEFIHHSEYELALDCLTQIASRQNQNSDFTAKIKEIKNDLGVV